MPLRDHFRPPLSDKRRWDVLYGQWPAMIVQRLFPLLPARYYAGPSVHLSHSFEVDVGAMEEGDGEPNEPFQNSGGRIAVKARPVLASAPTLTVETEWPDQEEYEVRVFDEDRGGRLVAAVEIISPSNKDCPES